MKLHLDKDAFRVLIESIHNKTGYRSDVLEKDYYVVLILNELAKSRRTVLLHISKEELRYIKLSEPQTAFLRI
jgi:hypothetical protein